MLDAARVWAKDAACAKPNHQATASFAPRLLKCTVGIEKASLIMTRLSPARKRAWYAKRRLAVLQSRIQGLPPNVLDNCALRQLSFKARRLGQGLQTLEHAISANAQGSELQGSVADFVNGVPVSGAFSATGSASRQQASAESALGELANAAA